MAAFLKKSYDNVAAPWNSSAVASNLRSRCLQTPGPPGLEPLGKTFSSKHFVCILRTILRGGGKNLIDCLHAIMRGLHQKPSYLFRNLIRGTVPQNWWVQAQFRFWPIIEWSSDSSDILPSVTVTKRYDLIWDSVCAIYTPHGTYISCEISTNGLKRGLFGCFGHFVTNAHQNWFCSPWVTVT